MNAFFFLASVAYGHGANACSLFDAVVECCPAYEACHAGCTASNNVNQFFNFEACVDGCLAEGDTCMGTKYCDDYTCGCVCQNEVIVQHANAHHHHASDGHSHDDMIDDGHHHNGGPGHVDECNEHTHSHSHTDDIPDNHDHNFGQSAHTHGCDHSHTDGSTTDHSHTDGSTNDHHHNTDSHTYAGSANADVAGLVEESKHRARAHNAVLAEMAAVTCLQTQRALEEVAKASAIEDKEPMTLKSKGLSKNVASKTKAA